MNGRRRPRRSRPALPPRGLRPKLSRQQLRDLCLAHIVNLDAFARGEADETILWQWIGGVLTWSRVAEKLGAGTEEMRQQLDTVTAVIERYGRTGRIGLSGPEYQAAKDGCGWMDDLAQLVDLHTASEAADWSEARVNRWAAQHTARTHAAAGALARLTATVTPEGATA